MPNVIKHPGRVATVQHSSISVFLLLFIAMIMVMSLFYVWARIEVTSLEYEISAHESRLRQLNKETLQLKIEVATLETPSRIESIARKELGLREPVLAQIVRVQ